MPISFAMEDRSSKKFFFLSGLGVLALGVFVFSLLFSRQENAHNAEIFHSRYLASIQHANDLGKNLNSYSDFLYDEIKSPRNREPSVFVEKTKSSLKLLLSKDILSSAKKKETESSFNELLEKSDLIMEHLRVGDSQLARRIYEKEFLEKLKAFNMSLDSHKTYLQNKANRFFSMKVAQVGVDTVNPFYIAFFLLALALLGLGALAIKLRSFTNKSLANRREMGARIEAIANHSFQLREIIGQIREKCEKALEVENPWINLRTEPLWSGRIASAPLAGALERRTQAVSNLQEELLEASREIKAQSKQVEGVWLDCAKHLEGFSKLKVQLINSDLSGNSRYDFGPELLSFLEELESLFSQNPFSRRGWDEFDSRLDKISEGAAEFDARVRKEAASLEESSERLRFESAKSHKDLGKALERAKLLAEKSFLRRNELIAGVLVLTDGLETGEDCAESENSPSKAA